MKDLLKTMGSICLHTERTASHYLKLFVDAVYGNDKYLNEFSWVRSVPKNDYIQGAVNWSSTRDVMLHYRASAANPGFRQPFWPLSQGSAANHYRQVEPEIGSHYPLASLTASRAGTRGHP